MQILIRNPSPWQRLVTRVGGDAAWQRVRVTRASQSIDTAMSRMPFRHDVYPICRFSTTLPAGAFAALETSGLEVRVGAEADIARIETGETWRSCDVYREWLRAGWIVIIGEQSNNIVSYGWQLHAPAFSLDQIPNKRFPLGPHECFSDEAYTPRAHRGRGFRRLVFLGEMKVAAALGKRFVLGYFMTPQEATDGCRNFGRVGIRSGTVARVHTVQFAGVKIAWCEKGRG